VHENTSYWKLLLEYTCQVYYMKKALFIFPCKLTQLEYYKLECHSCPVFPELLWRSWTLCNTLLSLKNGICCFFWCKLVYVAYQKYFTGQVFSPQQG